MTMIPLRLLVIAIALRKDIADVASSSVAGVAGSTGLGVAIDANLINVKVFPTRGVWIYSQLITAINDIYGEHNDNKANLKGFRGSIVNMFA